MLRSLLAIAATATIALTGAVADPVSAASAVDDEVLLPDGSTVAVEHVELVRDTFDAINEYRESRGLLALRFAPDLYEIAQDWSDLMIANDDFEHRWEHWTLYPRGWSRAGEIIAARGNTDTDALVQQWINSDDHRAIMLSSVTVMGPGIAFDSENVARYGMYGTINFGAFSEGSISTFASIDEWIAAGSESNREDAVGGWHSVEATVDGTITVEGWGIDFTRRDLATTVRVTLDGRQTRSIEAGQSIWPWMAGEWRDRHDFRARFRAEPGTHTVCVVVEDRYGAGSARDLGCREALVPFPTERLAGPNRYDTAVEISQRYHADDDVRTVYLATGARYPDALSLAPAAAQPGNALLLTPQAELRGTVAAELARLDPADVVIVGAEDSVSARVEQQVAAAVPGVRIERLDGANRYETSVLIAEHAFPDATLAYVASGQVFPDALSAAPVAASRNAPVILTPQAGLHEAVEAYVAASSIRHLVIAGGQPSVSAATESQLRALIGVAPQRIAGENRYDTNRQLAATVSSGQQSEALLASGLNFPDALAGASVAAGAGPLLLARTDCVPTETADVITDEYRPGIVVVLGGTPTLTEAAAGLSRCG